MLRKWNRFLAFLLAAALVFTTLGNDCASIKVVAADGETVETESNSDELWEPIPGEETGEEGEAEDESAEESTDDASAEAADETSEEAPGDATEETSEEATTDDSATEASSEDAAVEASSDDAAGEASSDDAASEASSDDAASEASSVVEEKLVTVRYKATLGGRVSNKKETIDINDKDAAFEGSTATAFNKYYQFVAWTDEDGEVVCNDATFVPSEVEADTTFTAEFMKLSEMPAADFEESVAGMNVTVHADEGIFPEGTTMSVAAISDEEAVDAAKDALGENVKEAKGVDITFRNADGEEIEPADSKYVHVTITLSEELEGESFSVVHKDDVGNASKVAEAEASGAEFDANSFSVYIVAGEDHDEDDDDKKAICTYNFYYGDEVYNTQKVKKGDTLADPGIPPLKSNEEFFGWYTKNDADEYDERIIFGKVEGQAEADSEVKAYAKILTTYYLTYIGVDKEVARVDKLTIYGDESTEIDLTKFHVTPKKGTQAFKGWALTPDGEVIDKIDVAAMEKPTVYAVVIDAIWISFDENDDTYDEHGIKIESGGASYTSPIYVSVGEKAKEPTPVPTRPGYNFGGWYKEKGDKAGEVKGDPYDWNTVITEDTEEFTLYAKWDPKSDTEYTVVIWQQKITDSKEIKNNESKHYDYKTSFKETGTTGAKISAEEAVAKYNKNGDAHFHVSWAEVVRYSDDVKITTDEIRAKGDTVINVYYDRNLMSINFKEYVDGKWSTYETFEGLFGQTLQFNSYKWPSEGSYSVHGTTFSPTTMWVDFIDTFILDAYTDKDSVDVYKEAENSTSKLVLHYYKEQLDGSWAEVNTVTHKSWYGNAYQFFCDDYYTGFTPTYYIRGGKKFELKVGTEITGRYPEELYLYFKRNTYEVQFKDYFDGTLSDVTGADSKFLKVPYEAPMNNPEGKSYLINYENLAPTLPDRPGYKFAGWFLDTSGADGAKYKWDDTMPAANKVLYAGYKKLKCKVTLVKNGGTYEGGNLEDKTDPLSNTWFNVDYGEILDKVSLINNVKRPGYQFVGWFLSNEDNADPCGYGAVFDDITLYAKWRNPGIVNIIYVPGKLGSEEPVDLFNYAPDSSVVVGAPPLKVEADYTFIGWKIAKKNGDEYTDVDGLDILYPNNSFTIKEEYITKASDGQKVYLRAVYEEVGGPGTSTATTIIRYHSNDGKNLTTTVTKDDKGKDLRVNESVKALTLNEAFGDGFDRKGYKFLGWSKESDATEAWLKAGEEYKLAADNKDEDGKLVPKKEDAPNDLYAVWEKINYKIIVTIEGNVGEDYYDGTEHTTTGYTVNSIKYYVDGVEDTEASGYSEADFKLAPGVSATASRTDVGTTAMKLDVSAQSTSFVNTSTVFTNVEFNVVKDGAQIVNPIELVITVVGNTKTVVYNGELQDVTGYTLNIPEKYKSLYEGEKPVDKINFTGLAKAEGKDVDTYPMNLSKDQFSNSNNNIKVTFDVTDGWLKITPIKDEEIIVTIVGNKNTDSYDGDEHTTTGYVVKSISNPLYTEADFEFSGKAEAKGTDVGTYPMNLDKSQFKNINKNFENVTFKVTDGAQIIEPIKLTITVVGNTKTVTYDGKSHDVTGYELTIPEDYKKFYEGSKAVDKIVFTGEAKAEGIDVGTYPMNLTAKQFSNSNNNIKVTFDVTDGWLKITPADEVVVTIVGNVETDEYDGFEHTAKGYVVKEISSPLYKETDFEFTGKAEASRTEVGTTEMGLTKDQFKNKSDKFKKVTFVVTDGAQTITPVKLVIPVVGNTDTVEYDGEKHEVTDYVLTIPEKYKSLYEGEKPVDEIIFTGEAKAEGTEVGTYPMNLTAAQFKNSNSNISVTFEVTDGWLKITPIKEVVVTIEGNVGTDDYDGEEHTTTDYVVTDISNPLYTEADFEFSGKAEASRTDVGTTPMGLTAAQFKNISKNFTKVTFLVTDGSQTIEPIELVIPVVGNTKTVTYDGKLHDVTGYELTIPKEYKKLYEGENPVDEIIFTGEAKAEGVAIDTYPMNLSKDQFKNSNANITVTFEVTDGWLKIVGRGDDELFVIKAVTDSVTKTYSGEYYDGFEYTLTASEQKNSFVAFLSSFINPSKAEPSTGDVVTIDGADFTVKGLHVDTSERNVGEYLIAIEGYDEIEITDEYGNVVTDQFTKLDKEEGTLTIVPLDITVTSGSATKYYDASPLTNHDVKTSIEWCPGDDVTYDVTGSQTAVGSSANTFTLVCDDLDLLNKNYNITLVEGTLTVLPNVTPPDPPTPDPPTPDPPTPPVPTPPTPGGGEVLGARREEGQAVLGARRGNTEDQTNDLARLFAIIVSAAVAIGLLFTSKKKEEKESN